MPFDLRPLWLHCIKNQHHSVKDITTWAQEHFGKTLSVQKPASVMVWGCVSAHGIGTLYICEGTINVTTALLCGKRVRVLDWPACIPDLSPIENVWSIMKRKIQQQSHQTFEQLKSYMKQEWERIPPTTPQQLASSVPKHSVVERKGELTQRYTFPCSFGTCCRHQIQNEWIFISVWTLN